MKHLIILCLFVSSVSAVTVDVIGATATQGLIAVRGCYDDITLSGLSPAVNDWDETKFTNANKAGAHNNTVGLNSGYTVLTIGQRTAKHADDVAVFDPVFEPKSVYSLALQAFTRHTGTVTCSAGSATFSFLTANIPWGAGRREPWQQEGTTGGILREGGDDYIDHVTGVRHVRFVGQKDQIVGNWPTKADHDAGTLDYTGDATANPPFGSGWTNPQNVFGTGEATTTGNGWLFVGWGGSIISDTVGLAINRGDVGWLNASVTGNCTDTGDGSCASGGNLMDMCITMDGVKCATRISRFALSPTSTQTWVCGPEHTNADTTGCPAANRGLPDSWNRITMWNASSF